MIALALCAALLSPAAAKPAAANKEATTDRPAITLDEYRDRLEEIDGSLANGDRSGAAREASEILHCPIRSSSDNNELLAPDRLALEPIAEASAPPHRARLSLLLRSLGNGALPAEQAAAPDKLALKALQKRVTSDALEKGGTAAALNVDRSVIDSSFDWIGRGVHWVGRFLARVWRWLTRAFPENSSETSSGFAHTNLLIFVTTGFVLVLAVVLALLARAARKRRPVSALEQRRAPVAEDGDPLSRSTLEWEQRARDLTASDRPREAIRAWYHAVLVGCYASGRLHHRRGRTNWEYAAALSPATPWRPLFFELTRWFDEQWYGRAESTREALDRFSEEAGQILNALRGRAQ